MIPSITIKLALFTDSGMPCGTRLERGTPLPTYDFTFEDTIEGRKKAEQAKAADGGVCDQISRAKTWTQTVTQ